VVSVSSTKEGFYEAPRVQGDYRICTASGRCTDVSVGIDELVRLDSEMSVGPGWSR